MRDTVPCPHLAYGFEVLEGHAVSASSGGSWDHEAKLGHFRTWPDLNTHVPASTRSTSLQPQTTINMGIHSVTVPALHKATHTLIFLHGLGDSYVAPLYLNCFAQ